jgi:hypothetical protein
MDDTRIVVGKNEGVLVREDGSWMIRVDPQHRVEFDLPHNPSVFRHIEGWCLFRQDDGSSRFVPGTIRTIPMETMP